ncbi:MAG: leucine-rich repeat protein [Eubacterium sp.]|nr:leucine-rich repeat protein [Eubacterium sp.]
MKTRTKRVFSIVLSLILALAFVPVTGPKADSARAATAVSVADTALTADSVTAKSAYQLKHKLAKAVEVMRKAEAGELKTAVEELSGTDGYYQVLTDDEKKIYTAIAQVYVTFQPFSSSNEFFDKAKSDPRIEDALADDVMSGRVALLDFGNAYSKDEVKQMFSMASVAYAYDHPYNLLRQMYRVSYFKKGSMYFFALNHLDTSEDFDYNQWGQSLIQFEKEALTVIVNDKSFSMDSAPIKEYLVHEYICSRVKYDYSKPGMYTLQWHKSKSAYGPMVENLGVCIGISYMAKILLDDLGVSSFIIHSGTHAWNMVYLDGSYYELDCTWDLATDKGVEYKYFNRTTDELLTLDTSGAHARASDSARVPTATGTTYTYDYVCQLLNVSNKTNQDKTDDPKYSKDDYVDNEQGEIQPNQQDYEYNGLLYDLFSEGYAVCKGASGNPKSINIPDSVTVTDEGGTEIDYEVVMLDDGAFSGKKSLKKVTLTGMLSYVGEKAFYNCANLKTITINSVINLISIEKNAFKGIAKKPTFNIYADSAGFKEAKTLIIASGTPKKTKYKRMDV